MAATKKHIQKKSRKPKAKSLDEFVNPDINPVLTKEQELEHKRRIDWQLNNDVIGQAFFQHILKNKKFPTYTALARATRFNERTIRRHFENSDILGDQELMMKSLRDKSLMTIAVKAMQGKSVVWNRLFHEIVDGLGSKKQIELSTTKIRVTRK